MISLHRTIQYWSANNSRLRKNSNIIINQCSVMTDSNSYIPVQFGCLPFQYTGDWRLFVVQVIKTGPDNKNPTSH